jgi:hypothetical protein
VAKLEVVSVIDEARKALRRDGLEKGLEDRWRTYLECRLKVSRWKLRRVNHSLSLVASTETRAPNELLPGYEEQTVRVRPKRGRNELEMDHISPSFSDILIDPSNALLWSSHNIGVIPLESKGTQGRPKDW